MADCIAFPDTVEEFMEQYKVVDTEQVYTNGSELVPIFRMKQWFEHLPSAQPERKCGRWEMLQIPISPPVYKCSVCGSHALQTLTGCLVNRHYESNLTKFCPNCGADMRGDDTP